MRRPGAHGRGMTPEYISNAASLEAWLNEQRAKHGEVDAQAQETYLASRSAMRALPSGWHELRASSKEYTTSAEINLLRCNLIALVGSVRRTEKVKQAAANAAFRFNAASYSRAGKLSYYAADTSNHAANSVGKDALQLTSVRSVASFASKIGWKQLRIDAATAELSTRENPPPLWNEKPAADWDTWLNLKAGLVYEQDEELLQYLFWIDLIDDVARGSALNWDMLQEIVETLTPDQWDAGYTAVTPIINGIWEKHRKVSAIELFQATLYDFTFDEVAHLMRAVPMPDDWKTLHDPKRLQDFLTDALDVREDFALLSQALAAEGMGAQGAGTACVYIGQMLDELQNAETVGALRIGKLVEWGHILEGMATREDTMREFGATHRPFEMAVGKFKDLVRNHFAHTLARFSQLRDIRMEEDAQPWDVVRDLRDTVAQVKDGGRGALPPLDPVDAAILDDILDSIDRLIRELDGATVGDTRSSLKSAMDFQMAKVGATAGLYADKAKRATGVGNAADAADGILRWEKRGKGLWEMIRAVREGFRDLGGL